MHRSFREPGAGAGRDADLHVVGKLDERDEVVPFDAVKVDALECLGARKTLRRAKGVVRTRTELIALRFAPLDVLDWFADVAHAPVAAMCLPPSHADEKLRAFNERPVLEEQLIHLQLVMGLPGGSEGRFKAPGLRFGALCRCACWRRVEADEKKKENQGLSTHARHSLSATAQLVS